MKTCNRCKIEKDLSEFYKNRTYKDGVSYYCKTCDSTYARNFQGARTEKYNKRKYEHMKRFPERQKARDKVRTAIKNGSIQRSCCEVCKEEKAQAHHDDYTKPLEVRWLCTTHHAEWHRLNTPIYE